MKNIAIFLSLIFVGCSAGKQTGTQTPANQLVNTKWTLMTLAADTISLPKSAFIIFTNDQKLNGFAGCNMFFGKYENKGSSIQINSVGSTKMACPEMNTEDKFLQFLQEADQYNVESGQLTLYKKGFAIAHFVNEGYRK